MKLTDAEVRKLTLPAKVADKVFFDDDLPGFGVRVRAGGAQRWMVQYDVPGGRTRRMSLGRTSANSLAKARTMARDILAAVRLGQDPAADKAAKRLALRPQRRSARSCQVISQLSAPSSGRAASTRSSII